MLNNTQQLIGLRLSNYHKAGHAMRHTRDLRLGSSVRPLRCATLAFALACAKQQPKIADEPLMLRTIDSTWTEHPWAEDEDDNRLQIYRMEARRSGRADTITDVIEPMPFVVGKDSVAGLRLVRSDTGLSDREIFIYSSADGKTRSWPLPDVGHLYNDVMISPDARYVAYTDGDAPIVREISTNRVVLRGPGGGACECDFDRNHARWLNADSVEILVIHDADKPSGWLLFAGRPSTKAAHVRMLDTKPDWPGH
jgi:hypothetical protein